MEDKKLGVAIHGVGDVAYAHAAAWMKNPHVEIVFVSSRRKQSAQRLVDKLELDSTVGDSFDQVLGDDRVDIVNLSGPNHVHAEQGIAAVATGKHILIEKPMVLSIEENQALRDAVTQAGVKSRRKLRVAMEPHGGHAQVAAGRSIAEGGRLVKLPLE